MNQLHDLVKSGRMMHKYCVDLVQVLFGVVLSAGHLDSEVVTA